MGPSSPRHTTMTSMIDAAANFDDGDDADGTPLPSAAAGGEGGVDADRGFTPVAAAAPSFDATLLVHDDDDDAGGATGGGIVARGGGGVSGEGGGGAGVSPHSSYLQGPGWDQLPPWGGRAAGQISYGASGGGGRSDGDHCNRYFGGGVRSGRGTIPSFGGYSSGGGGGGLGLAGGFITVGECATM